MRSIAKLNGLMDFFVVMVQNSNVESILLKKMQVFLLRVDLSKKSSNEYKMYVILQKLIPSIMKEYNVWTSI